MPAADSLAAFVAWLQGDGCACCPSWAELPDGSLICVNESEVWVRTDPPADQPLRTINGHETGDWYLLDGTEDGRGPVSFGEVMGLDDPPCDRRFRTFEALYTDSDLMHLVARFRRESGDAP